MGAGIWVDTSAAETSGAAKLTPDVSAADVSTQMPASNRMRSPAAEAAQHNENETMGITLSVVHADAGKPVLDAWRQGARVLLVIGQGRLPVRLE